MAFPSGERARMLYNTFSFRTWEQNAWIFNVVRHKGSLGMCISCHSVACWNKNCYYHETKHVKASSFTINDSVIKQFTCKLSETEPHTHTVLSGISEHTDCSPWITRQLNPGSECGCRHRPTNAAPASSFCWQTGLPEHLPLPLLLCCAHNWGEAGTPCRNP